MLHDAEAEMDRVEREMYVIARQLWSLRSPMAPCLPMTLQADGHHAAGARRFSHDHGTVDKLVGDIRTMSPGSRRLSTRTIFCAYPSRITVRSSRCRSSSAALRRRILNPAPPLDPKARAITRSARRPADWDARRVQELPARVQPSDAADPHHPRGLSQAITCSSNTPIAIRR